MTPRIVLEDFLVAQARHQRLMRATPVKRTFGPGSVDQVAVAHRLELEGRAADLKLVTPTDEDRRGALEVARRRLAADRHAGRCLCHLHGDARCLTAT